MFATSAEESVCTFYLLSSCTRGQKCPFLHSCDVERVSAGRKDPCYFFLKGRCNDGDLCQRSHNEPPSFNGTIKKICLYFSLGRCGRGKLCSYSHDLPMNVEQPMNVVSPVVINTSDVQSMAAAPKLCRFYLRGMCFFGENCTNFHDKPEKDPEDFIADLREDEVLNEISALDLTDFPVTRDKNSNDLPIKNKEIGELEFNKQLKAGQVTSCSSKSEDLLNTSSKPIKMPPKVDFEKSTKPNAFPYYYSTDSSNSVKSADLTYRPCKSEGPSNFSNSKKISKIPNNSSISKKSLKDSLNSKEFFRESNSKPKELVKGAFSKSKKTGKNRCTSDSKKLIAGTHNFSKSKEYFRSVYSQSKKFSDITHSKEWAEHSSRPKSSRNAEGSISIEHYRNVVPLQSKEFIRNSEERSRSYPIEQFESEVNSMKPIQRSKVDLRLVKGKEFVVTKPSSNSDEHSSSKTQFIVACNFSKHKEEMTRKQSKSQRKLKPEQSRIFFKRLFFKTPVPVTHVTKK